MIRFTIKRLFILPMQLVPGMEICAIVIILTTKQCDTSAEAC